MGFISSRFITAKAAFHHCTFSFITAHFVHHCTLKQALPLATRPSITSEVSEVVSPFGRPSRAAGGPQLHRTDCRLSVPRKIGKTSETVTFSPVARLRELGSKPKSPT